MKGIFKLAKSIDILLDLLIRMSVDGVEVRSIFLRVEEGGCAR